ncbi:hypothetical protein PMAYCL1PPCAC_03323, partial [Pristionchus mayeri]
WALLAFMVVGASSSELLNSINELQLEGQAFFSRMSTLSDEAKEAASEIASIFISSLQNEESVSDDEVWQVLNALPANVQDELKRAFPEFFEEELDEEERIEEETREKRELWRDEEPEDEEERGDEQSKAFILN